MEEKELISKAKRGDQDAFGQLVLAHQNKVYTLCVHLLGNREEAEDLAQEVFLRAMQNAHIFEDLSRSQRRAWLFRTLKNILMDSYRKTAVENRYAQYFQPEEAVLEPGFGQTEANLILQKLPQEDRVLFYLRYIQGYSASELSEIFNMPAGTVRAKLSRSRKILKDFIADK